jgi:hypothetical protein
MTATSSLPPFRSPCEAHLVGRAVALQAVRPSAKAGSSASRQSCMPVWPYALTSGGTCHERRFAIDVNFALFTHESAEFCSSLAPRPDPHVTLLQVLTARSSMC